MTKNIEYKCNVCGKPISGEHDKLYMATINIKYYKYNHDDGSEIISETYHVHNGFTNNCLKGIVKLLNKSKK
ncbi:MAG: hypothetical protein ACP5OG_04875 [Candidatus Nanoarchaeia archaeon]